MPHRRNNKKKKRTKQRPDAKDCQSTTVGPALDSDDPGNSQLDASSNAVENPHRSPVSQSEGYRWVQRLLLTHYQTLEDLSVERENFPNTRMSLRQLDTMLAPLIELAKQITAKDLGLCQPTPQVAASQKGLRYLRLFESNIIDIGIFIFPPGGVIPLHNHPGMSVVTKVLYGTVNVTSYDRVSSSECEVADTEDENVFWAKESRQGDFQDSTTWLDPRRFNLHHLAANCDIGCAILDITTPPYDDSDRDCHHFDIIEERRSSSNDRLVKLKDTIAPDPSDGAVVNGGT